MKKIKAVILLVAAMFFFSFIGVFSRLAEKDPFSVSFYRAIFTVTIFFFFFPRLPGWARGSEANPEKEKVVKDKPGIKDLKLTLDKVGLIVPYGLCVGITILTFICGYLYTTMANAVLLHYLMPIFVFLGSFSVTGEKVRSRTILSFVLSIIGVVLITGFDLVKGVSGRALLGNFLAFISGISYAGIILWTRKARLIDIDIVYFIFWGWMITAIFCLPFVIAFGDFRLSFHSFLVLLGMAFFSTVLPFIISNLAIRDLTAQAASIIAYSEAVFVMVWGAVFYKEGITLVTLIGAGLIFFSLLMMVQQEKKKDKIAVL